MTPLYILSALLLGLVLGYALAAALAAARLERAKSDQIRLQTQLDWGPGLFWTRSPPAPSTLSGGSSSNTGNQTGFPSIPPSGEPKPKLEITGFGIKGP